LIPLETAKEYIWNFLGKAWKSLDFPWKSLEILGKARKSLAASPVRWRAIGGLTRARPHFADLSSA
jgi:hypothetical protein